MEEFDAEKVLEMSREELINLLGEDAQKVKEGLENGDLTAQELDEICKRNFSYEQRGKLVRNLIVTKLSEKEGFCLFESDKKKQEQYCLIYDLQEKARNGKINKADIKLLCDIVFGKDTELSRQVQEKFIESGKIIDENSEENEI